MALVTGSRQDGNWILTGFQVAEGASGCLEYLQEKLGQIVTDCFLQESQLEKVRALQGCWRDGVMHVERKVTGLGCSDPLDCL